MAASRDGEPPLSSWTLVATDPLLQPDVMALMVQDAYSSRSPLLRPCWQASGPLPDGEHHPDTRSSQPRSSQLAPPDPAVADRKGPASDPLPGRPGPDPASNIAMACAISVTSRGVVTSTPGVPYLSITRLETGSEYLSKQSHSHSNIGAGASNRASIAGLVYLSAPGGPPSAACQPPATKWNPTSRHLAPIACHQGLPVFRHEGKLGADSLLKERSNCSSWPAASCRGADGSFCQKSITHTLTPCRAAGCGC